MKTVGPYTILGLFTVVLFLGCAVYRSQETPVSIDIPQEYRTAASVGLHWPDDDRWWVVFSDPHLDDLMKRAFDANLDLAQAFSRLEQLEAIARQTNAMRYPFLGLEANVSHTKQPAVPKDVSGNAYGLSLGATFGVDLWQEMKNRYDARGFDAAASLEDVRALYLVLSAQVADLYYRMVEQRALIDLAELTIVSRKETLDLVERRYLEGIVSTLDVYQARQILAGTRTRLPGYEAALQKTAHALSFLLGQYPEKDIGGDLAVLPAISDAFPKGLPSELLIRRPDIQAQLLRLKATDAAVGAAVAERFPSINLLAGAGYSGSDVGVNLTGMTWNIAGNLFMPLVDWGRRKAEVDRTQAVFQEQYSRYRKVVLTAFREVEDALVNTYATEATIGRLEEEETAARAALRLASNRYRDGLSDYLPVLTAQALHFDTRIRMLSVRRQLISDRINLATALGGRWMDWVIARRHNG